METYDVAFKNKKIKDIIGMTFLDQQDKEVRYRTSRNWFMGHIAVPMLNPDGKNRVKENEN